MTDCYEDCSPYLGGLDCNKTFVEITYDFTLPFTCFLIFSCFLIICYLWIKLQPHCLNSIRAERARQFGNGCAMCCLQCLGSTFCSCHHCTKEPFGPGIIPMKGIRLSMAVLVILACLFRIMFYIFHSKYGIYDPSSDIPNKLILDLVLYEAPFICIMLAILLQIFFLIELLQFGTRITNISTHLFCITGFAFSCLDVWFAYQLTISQETKSSQIWLDLYVFNISFMMIFSTTSFGWS